MKGPSRVFTAKNPSHRDWGKGLLRFRKASLHIRIIVLSIKDNTRNDKDENQHQLRYERFPGRIKAQPVDDRQAADLGGFQLIGDLQGMYAYPQDLKGQEVNQSRCYLKINAKSDSFAVADK